MKFLEQQQSARRRATLLWLPFGLFAIVGVALTNVALALLLGPFTLGASTILFTLAVFSFLEPSDQPDSIWQTPLLMVALTAVTFLTLILFVLIKRSSLLHAGKYLAKSLDAQRIDASTKVPEHKRALNATHEMALAAGIPAPTLYLLPEAFGINAFCAGHTVADASLFLTPRALSALTREELQALIGHEFGHILSGDMALNVRLISYVYAFSVVPRAGLDLLTLPARAKSFDDRMKFALLWPFYAIPFAMPVILLSGVNYLAAKILQAAIVRQQEVFADAAAVQFTRNPQALKSLLLKTLFHGTGLSLASPSVLQDTAHMFFGEVFVRRLFATHPSIEKRILAVDSRGLQEGEVEQMRRAEKERLTQEAEREMRRAIAGAQRQRENQDPAALGERAAARSAAFIQNAVALTLVNAGVTVVGEVDDSGGGFALDLPVQSYEILLALLLEHGTAGRRRQLSVIGELLGPNVVQAVSNAFPRVSELPPEQRAMALDAALPALREIDKEQISGLLSLMTTLETLDDQTSVFEYALTRMAAVFLKDLAKPKLPHGNRTLESMGAPVSVLFSVVASHTRRSRQAAAEAYEIGMQRLLPRRRPAFVQRDSWAVPLDAALAQLEDLQPIAKDMLLEALTVTVRHDGLVTPEERELVRAIAACLHCPMPRELTSR